MQLISNPSACGVKWQAGMEKNVKIQILAHMQSKCEVKCQYNSKQTWSKMLVLFLAGIRLNVKYKF